MIETNQLNWGYRPIRDVATLAVYGARTIFQNSRIEFLQGRQQCLGSEDAQKALLAWLNTKALPKLKKHITEKHWLPVTQEMFSLETWSFAIDASPKGSCGYIYITAYLKGLDEFPQIDEQHKWSADFIPKIGEIIHCRVNELDAVKVLGYYIEDGWIGVITKPENPPEWFIRQNGKDAICGLFGAEIRKNINY